MNFLQLFHKRKPSCQHAVTIAEKAILFCNGDFVGFEHEIATGESGHLKNSLTQS